MTLHPPRARIAALLLLATLALAGPAAAAQDAAPWTVKPAANNFGADRESYGYTINPGGKIEDGIVVENPGSTPLHLAVQAAKGVTASDGQLKLVTKDATSSGVGAWVQPDSADVTVEPGQSVEVPFTITLPDDAAPGDYAGGIVTSQEGAEAGIRIGLRVGGALKPSLAVENVQVDYSSGDATVSYTVHNTGNAILGAGQKVSVSGPFGRWTAKAGEIAPSPPLLPGERWKASVPVPDVTPALRLSANVSVVPLLTDAAGSTAPLAVIETTGHGWAIPWSLLLVVVLVCGLLIAGLAFRSRRSKRVASPA